MLHPIRAGYEHSISWQFTSSELTCPGFMEEMAPSDFASAPKGYSFLCTEYCVLYSVQIQPLPLALLSWSEKKVQTCTIDSHEEAGEAPGGPATKVHNKSASCRGKCYLSTFSSESQSDQHASLSTTEGPEFSQS